MAQRLRELRRERGYSLEQVATRCGVSRATLSQIETNKTNPTLGVLWKIAAGLGVQFSSLLVESPEQHVQVVRRGSQGVLTSEDGVFESRPLTPARALGNVELYELTLAPRATHTSPPHPAGTVETVVVLSGALCVRIGDSRAEGSAGDTIYFRADDEHAYENPGRVPTRVVNVITYLPGG